MHRTPPHDGGKIPSKVTNFAETPYINKRSALDLLGDSPPEFENPEKKVNLEGNEVLKSPIDEAIEKMIMTNKLAKELQKQSTMNSYNIPVKNSFEVLTNEQAETNKVNLQRVQKTKIPPITVVGTTNFANAMKILNDVSPNSGYTIKYMSIGTKILLNNSESYIKMKGLLVAADIEFFSHDANPDKYDKFILSGIEKMPIQNIFDALKIYQAEPSEVREISQYNKKFDNEGSYIVSFKHRSIKMVNLTKIRINYTIPKWRPIQKKTNNITQCRRCQLYGHGMRNCNMNPKCAKCGLAHPTDKCNSPIQKCANCKGDHQSTFLECPKREEFIQMRNKISSSKRNPGKPSSALVRNLENFPNLAKKSTTNHDLQIQNKISITDWSKVFKDSVPPPENTNCTSDGKFKIEEIGPIMQDLLSGLRVCRSKEEQLVVMFQLATKWIYNNYP